METDEILSEIVSDSFLIDIIDPNLLSSIDLSTIQSLLPLVTNFDLLIRFYSGVYDFTNDELIELSEYLRYIGSKRILEVLVIMKCTQHGDSVKSRINKYLLNDYDNINLDVLIDYNKSTNTLFKISIYYNLINIVRYLAHSISKIEMDNSLIFASKCGHVLVVEFLLHNGANIHANDDLALREACKNGHVDVINLLLDRGANIHAGVDEPLLLASDIGHTCIVKSLLERGANVRTFDDLALRRACENGHISVVHLLLDNGANIHADDEAPLQLASLNNYKDIVLLLLERGADIHNGEDCALQLAAFNGHKDMVVLLLEKGADIHAKNDSALKWASLKDHKEVVELLLEKMEKM